MKVSAFPLLVALSLWLLPVATSLADGFSPRALRTTIELCDKDGKPVKRWADPGRHGITLDDTILFVEETRETVDGPFDFPRFIAFYKVADLLANPDSPPVFLFLANIDYGFAGWEDGRAVFNYEIAPFSADQLLLRESLSVDVLTKTVYSEKPLKARPDVYVVREDGKAQRKDETVTYKAAQNGK